MIQVKQYVEQCTCDGNRECFYCVKAEILAIEVLTDRVITDIKHRLILKQSRKEMPYWDCIPSRDDLTKQLKELVAKEDLYQPDLVQVLSLAMLVYNLSENKPKKTDN